jgi:hypothetical protein
MVARSSSRIAERETKTPERPGRPGGRAWAEPSRDGRGRLRSPDCWRGSNASGRVHVDAARFPLSLRCRPVRFAVRSYRVGQRFSPAPTARSTGLRSDSFGRAHLCLDCGRRDPLGPGPTPRSRGLPSVPRARPRTRSAGHCGAAATCHASRPCGAFAPCGRTHPARTRAHPWAATRPTPSPHRSAVLNPPQGGVHLVLRVRAVGTPRGEAQSARLMA